MTNEQLINANIKRTKQHVLDLLGVARNMLETVAHNPGLYKVKQDVEKLMITLQTIDHEL